MKTAIVYSSKHGTTGKIARLIGEQFIDDEVDYISLKENKTTHIQEYDRIILGTSIYAGNPSAEMKKFCSNNRSVLDKKKIGLFICCMLKKREQEQLTNAYPKFLHKVAVTERALGGELLFDKMNLFERFLTRLVMKVKTSVYEINDDAIKLFTNEMK